MTNKIEIINNQKKIANAKDLYPSIRKAVNATLKYENVSQKCEISVCLTDNEEIKELNKQYRNIDKHTDVLSFPSGEYPSPNSPVFLGDVIISLEQAEKQSVEFGSTLSDEVAFLSAHSVLHLLGYDHMDKKEEKDMFDRQDQIMKIIGSKRSST